MASDLSNECGYREGEEEDEEGGKIPSDSLLRFARTALPQ